MSDLRTWIDLRDPEGGAVRLRIATIEGEDGRQRRFLYVTGLKNDSLRWQKAIEKLGFIASPGRRYLVRMCRDGEKITAEQFRPVWPNAGKAQLPIEQILLDVKPIRQARETQRPRTEEEKDISVETGVVVRLGRNADGDEVFSGPMGRHVVREGGQKIFETDLLGPATFLRAPTDEALNACADGFVHAMLQGEVQHSDDLDRFIQAVTDRDGPYGVEVYDRVATAIDAAMVRFLNGAYDTAQDAFGDGARLYEYLPPYKGAARGAAAMPLPLSVIAQRLLGDTKDKSVLVPNAWDGASFAFMSPGTRIQAFRGEKDLSRNVTGVREGDVTWRERFDPAHEEPANGIFFNADPEIDEDGSRKDYRQALMALRTLTPEGRAVIVLAGDDPRDPGALSVEAKRFLESLSRRYVVEAALELGAELTQKVGTDSTLRVFAVRNSAPIGAAGRVEGVQVVHSWDEVKSAVDEAIATAKVREAESEGIDIERTASGNDFQRPYVAFSKVGEARTMVPKNLQGPLQYALTELEKQYGPIDSFVEQELGFGPNTLGERFSPEQVDAIGLGLARMKSGRGIIIGDETGIGKGRTLSGFATWASKQGRNVIFVTDRANLFSDLVRDLRDVGEWGRFRPLVMNADGLLVDVFTNETLQKGTPPKVMNKIMADGMTLDQLQCNIVFATYSQISGEDSPKADWLLSQADSSFVVVDEAHVAAGSSSNTSLAVSELVNRAWAVGYSSATWAKTSENLHIYSRAFPETVNIASLTATMRNGGEAFSEVFSAMLARDGAFIRREHDLSKIEFTFDVDAKRKERNESLSDKVAGILAAMTYVSGDINRLLMRMNSDTMRSLKSAREARSSAATALAEQNAQARRDIAEGREPQAAPVATGSIMRASFGTGSVLYQVMRRFLSVLNADNVYDLAVKSIEDNRKPVIVFEDTGESFLKRIIQDQIIPGIDGERDMMPEMVRAPTIKDLLRNVMKRMAVVTVENVDEGNFDTATTRADVAPEEGGADEVDIDAIVEGQDAAAAQGRHLRVLDLPGLTREQQEGYEKGMQEIMKMIDELPPMPLNAVDLLKARLADAGLKVGEISGRGLCLEPTGEQRMLAIDDTGWDYLTWKLTTRSKKKADVNRTVFGFNSGEIDALFINRSAATGLSLHSSPRFADIRRRELIELQIPEDPTNRIQLFGRVNRYDQVVTPKISISTTGIFGEVRQLMMQNKKLSRLSANIRSSRDNAAEIKDVVDLLNPVGREVCKRFLEENGGVRNRLGVEERDLESGRDLAQMLTTRVALLSVAEQRMVYEEVYAMFEDTLVRYEMMGENPLKPREKDIRATTIKSDLVLGVEMDGFGSAFDGPVYLRELEWTEAKRPFGWRNVIEFVRAGRQEMLAQGMLKRLPDLDVPDDQDDEVLPQGIKLGDIPTNAAGALPVAMVSGMDLLNSNLLGGHYGNVPAHFLTPIEDGDVEFYAMRSEGLDESFDNRLDMTADTQARREQWTRTSTGFSTKQHEELLRVERQLPQVELGESITKLKRIMEAKVHIELAGSQFRDVETALAAQHPNGVKRAKAKQLWVEKYMPRLIPGCLVGMPPDLASPAKDKKQGEERDEMFYEWAVVTSIKSPPKGREAMISRWKVDVLLPGRTEVTSLSLGALMAGAVITADGEGVASECLIQGNILGCSVADGGVEAYNASRRDSMMRNFHRESAKSLRRRGYVLDGNLYLANEWAASTKMGSGIIYTDERGVRHRGVWLSNRYADRSNLIESMPIRLWSRTMIENFITRLSNPSADEDGETHVLAPNGPGGSYIIPTSFQAATPFGQNNGDVGTRVMILPGKGVALVVDKGDLGRMSRALRGYQKSQLRKLHPDLRSYTEEMKEEAKKDFPTVTTSAKKRGEKPIILLSADTPEQFGQVSDMLCQACGIEFYLPRGTALGSLAREIQEDYFLSRRSRAQAVQATALAARGVIRTQQGEADSTVSQVAQAQPDDGRGPDDAGDFERARAAA